MTNISIICTIILLTFTPALIHGYTPDPAGVGRNLPFEIPTSSHGPPSFGKESHINSPIYDDSVMQSHQFDTTYVRKPLLTALESSSDTREFFDWFKEVRDEMTPELIIQMERTRLWTIFVPSNSSVRTFLDSKPSSIESVRAFENHFIPDQSFVVYDHLNTSHVVLKTLRKKTAINVCNLKSRVDCQAIAPSTSKSTITPVLMADIKARNRVANNGIIHIIDRIIGFDSTDASSSANSTTLAMLNVRTDVRANLASSATSPPSEPVEGSPATPSEPTDDNLPDEIDLDLPPTNHTTPKPSESSPIPPPKTIDKKDIKKGNKKDSKSKSDSQHSDSHRPTYLKSAQTKLLIDTPNHPSSGLSSTAAMTSTGSATPVSLPTSTRSRDIFPALPWDWSSSATWIALAVSGCMIVLLMTLCLFKFHNPDRWIRFKHRVCNYCSLQSEEDELDFESVAATTDLNATKPLISEYDKAYQLQATGSPIPPDL